jgi:predicted RNase H-like nuclease
VLAPARRSGLPYRVLAGVEPHTGGWLIAPGNLQGINLGPQTAFLVPTLADVLDYRPSFTVVALHAPIGFHDEPTGPRTCDRNSRQLLGPRGKTVLPAPSRALLEARSFDEARKVEPGIDIVRWRALPKAAESARAVQSWNQRTVWEVNPELALRQMNGGKPVPFPRSSQLGRAERARLVAAALPGAAQVLKDRAPGVREGKLIDALADLWIARRIAARAITRTSDEPIWDSQGLRMDIVS